MNNSFIFLYKFNDISAGDIMKYLAWIFLLTNLFFNTAFPQWIPQNSNTNQRLLTTFFLNENLGWAGGNEGCIIKTTNGGLDWNYYSIGTKYTVHAIHFVDSLHGWAALYTFDLDRAGYIIATSDGGTNWYYQYYIAGVTLHNVYFYDQYFGWAVGSSGVFLRTVNGGATWQEDFASPQWAWSLCFLSPNLGWVGDGFSGYMRKTTDGGFTWQYKSVPSYSRMMDIFFLNQNLGWAVGNYGHILKTTDGGETWNHQNSGVTQELNDVEFIDENIGWAVGMNGVVLHSTNGGTTWFYQGNQVENDLYGLSCKSSQLGWIAGSNGIVLFTDNGGGDPLPVELISFKADYFENIVNLSWATASELNNLGFEVERKSKSEKWDKIAFIFGNGTTTETKHYSYKDDLKDVVVTKVYYRLKQIDLNGEFEYSNEIEIDINVPIKFQLNQNYPNPFNPTTTIKFQVPIKSNVSIKIFDVLGREVEVLVDEVKEAGFYNVLFDASKLASGVYLYSIQTENYSNTKKLILIK